MKKRIRSIGNVVDDGRNFEENPDFIKENSDECKKCKRCGSTDLKFLGPGDYKRDEHGNYNRVMDYKCKKCGEFLNYLKESIYEGTKRTLAEFVNEQQVNISKIDFEKIADEYLKGENVFNTHALGIRDFAKYLNNRKNDL
jgi:hypothetical protein